MLSLDNNTQAFFELVRAGLFPVHGEGGMVNASFFEGVDWGEVYRMAEEQSVVGLVSAGLDWFKVHDSRFKVPQTVVLQFVDQTLQIEQRNKAMNEFVACLIEELRNADCYAVLVKGQGVAQCYERPLWRACGDVDLLLSRDNYEKAKTILESRAEKIDEEDKNRLHLAMTIDGWIVELHGTLLTGISRSLNKVVSQVQSDIFYGGEVRSWMNGKTQVFLPSADNDVFLVFSHILEHFYVEGIGLRQICDWCRLLWAYRGKIDVQLLERRLRDAKILTEWKGFASLAVDALGMPMETMPLYDSSFSGKGSRIMEYVLETGNFGLNKDNSYRSKTSKLGGLFITFWRRVKEFAKLTKIFPTQTPKIFLTYVLGRVKANV